MIEGTASTRPENRAGITTLESEDHSPCKDSGTGLFRAHARSAPVTHPVSSGSHAAAGGTMVVVRSRTRCRTKLLSTRMTPTCRGCTARMGRYRLQQWHSLPSCCPRTPRTSGSPDARAQAMVDRLVHHL